MDDRPTFEDTYPKYPFAPLVRLALVAGTWIRGMLNRAKAPRPAAPRAPGKKGLYAD